MPDDHDPTATTASTAADQRGERATSRTQPGPELLEQRTLAGIFVHLLGAATSVVGPAAVYVASDHEFTRANARNACNWQAFYVGATVALFASVFGLAALPAASVPEELAGAVELAGSLYVGGWTLAVTLGFLANLVLPLVATAKAIFGDAWTYPLAPDVVGWLGELTDGDSPWWLLLGTYAIGAPAAFGAVALLALGVRDDVVISIAVLLLFWLLFGAAYSAAAIVADARQLTESGAAWQPRWPAYVGPPAVVGVLVYAVASPLWSSGNPSGDAVYAATAVFWVAVVGYLCRRRVRLGTP